MQPTKKSPTDLSKRADLVRIDRCKPYLRHWRSQGFHVVRIKLADVSCNICRAVRNAEFHIEHLLEMDNPLFRLTHPNCRCGMYPVPESHEDHKHFNEKYRYKKKIDEIKKAPAPTETPPIRRPGDKDQADSVDPALERKVDQVKKDIERTEKKLKEIDNPLFEIDDKEVKEEAEKKDISFKRYLHRYLDQLKKFLKDVDIKKQKEAEKQKKNPPLERD